MTRRYCCIIVLSVLLLNSSCLNRHFIDGSSELISISDTVLNDSSLFYGNVNHVDFINYPYPVPFEIWIDDRDNTTISDTTRQYFLKIKPGTYTIKCQNQNNPWSRLIEEMKNVRIEANKKIRIDFYIGYTIE